MVIGFAGYFYGSRDGNASPTALIPAAFGTVFVLLGVVGRIYEGMRRHVMHVAVGLALLGFILTAGRVLMKMAETGLTMSAPVASQLSMAVVCLIFLVLGIRSFAAARR